VTPEEIARLAAEMRANVRAAPPRPIELPAPESSWFECAADLLAEDDPGPTPFLVEGLVVEGAIGAFVGAPKNGKTWVLLDLAVAIVTGETALGRFEVPKPGPVLLILEESGRAALHRRLDKLVRGRGIDPARLADLYFAANRRVRLDEDEWREKLLDAARSREWRMIAFDPLARVKGAVDENVQREIGPVLDFLRDLRAESGAAVAYVHHTPHDGTRHRGSSDLEAYWESKVTIEKKKEDGRTLKAEHREAEAIGPFRFSTGFDATTGTLRLRVSRDELEERVRAYLDEHPTASKNEVDGNVEGTRARILELVDEIRGEGGSEAPNHPELPPSGSDEGGGSAGGAYKAPRTTPADLDSEGSSEAPNHPRPLLGDPGFLDALYAALSGGWITGSEFNQTERVHAFVRDVARARSVERDPERDKIERLADRARAWQERDE
jgi:hypothetical protein